MPKVYVVQESPGKNIIGAANFGEIVVLLPEGKQLGFSPGAMVHELRTKLSKFSDDDYLLLIGDPVAIGVVCAAASEWNRGRFKALKWDRQSSKYFPVQVDFYQERRKKNGSD